MRSIFSSLAVTAALVLAFGLSAVTYGKQGAGSPGDPDKYQVKIDNFSFTPGSLTVRGSCDYLDSDFRSNL